MQFEGVCVVGCVCVGGGGNRFKNKFMANSKLILYHVTKFSLNLSFTVHCIFCAERRSFIPVSSIIVIDLTQVDLAS